MELYSQSGYEPLTQFSGYAPYVGDFIPSEPSHLGLAVVGIVILIVCMFKFCR